VVLFGLLLEDVTSETPVVGALPVARPASAFAGDIACPLRLGAELGGKREGRPRQRRTPPQ
jgi:hypothetical protein